MRHQVVRRLVGIRRPAVLAAEYQTVLPDEKVLAEELVRTRRQIEARHGRRSELLVLAKGSADHR